MWGDKMEKYFEACGKAADDLSKMMTLKYYQKPGEDRYFTGHHKMTSLYYAHDLKNYAVSPLNKFSNRAQNLFSHPSLRVSSTEFGKMVSAQAQITERITKTYTKPCFNIDSITTTDGNVYGIQEEAVWIESFCTLVHFNKVPLETKSKSKQQVDVEKLPKVLVVAPYSGHYATLLRDTVNSLLPEHDVYITDWRNVRDVHINRGEFTLDKYIQYLINFIGMIDEDLHIVGVCQPAVPVLATAAILAETKSSLKPKSIILMGGPIDTRINPTKVNKLAKEKELSWFDQSIVGYVPHYYRGAYRRVIPGFIMLAGFMNLNLETHAKAPRKLFDHLVAGDDDSAEFHKAFYDEYRSVLDLPADYFLDSVYHAFQNHSLPKGEFTWFGCKVDTHAITKTAILTIEGEKDDISGVGQTKATHDICSNVPKAMQDHYVQKGVGHYGVFNGSRFRNQIVPKITEFIKAKR